MFRLRAKELRITLAALCVALTAVLVGQVPVAAVDQAQHRLGLDHPAVALAGQVVLEVDDHGDDGGHPQQIAATEDDDGVDPTPRHHHADGPQVPPLAAGADDAVVVARLSNHPQSVGTAPPGAMTFGLLRPPRQAFEDLA